MKISMLPVIFLTGMVHAGQVTLRALSPSKEKPVLLIIPENLFSDNQIKVLYEKLADMPTHEGTVPLYQICKDIVEEKASPYGMVKIVEQATPHYLFWKKQLPTVSLFHTRRDILTRLLDKNEHLSFIQEKYPYYFQEVDSIRAAKQLDAYQKNINKNLEAETNSISLPVLTVTTKFPLLKSPPTNLLRALKNYPGKSLLPSLASKTPNPIY